MCWLIICFCNDLWAGFNLYMIEIYDKSIFGCYPIFYSTGYVNRDGFENWFEDWFCLVKVRVKLQLFCDSLKVNDDVIDRGFRLSAKAGW